MIIARNTASSTTVVPLEDIINAADFAPSPPSVLNSPGTTTHGASSPVLPTIPNSPESQHTIIEHNTGYPRLPADFGTPPPSPTESEFDWPTQPSANKLAESAAYYIETNSAPTAFTMPNPIENAAEVALLNIAAEAAAQESAEAVQAALAGTKGSDNFDNFLSLVEAACVLESHAAALKATAKAAAERLAIQSPLQVNRYDNMDAAYCLDD